MELKEAILGRRSIRKYNDIKISDEDLNNILEAASFAPSGLNLQPWYFVICRSDEAKGRLLKIIEGSLFTLKETLTNRFPKNPEVIDETIDFVGKMGGADICVLAFLQKEGANFEIDMANIESTAAAMENMALTAYSLGISSCWLTAPLNVEDELKEEFAKGKGRMVASMTLGYSDIKAKAPKRKEGRFNII